tara:strand:- start:130 stop:654 length:525 start_codon:yes stop_codon:yes gene_type:complete
MPESQQPEWGQRWMTDWFREQRPDKTIDIGAGYGKWGRLLKGLDLYCDAIEGHLPYIEKFDLTSIYGEVINSNMMDVPLETYRKYNTAILGDVLEHVDKSDGLKLLEKLKAAVSNIWLTIPITVCHQDGDIYGNPLETHRYHWSDKEVQHEGFELINVGANGNGLVAIGTYIWR